MACYLMAPSHYLNRCWFITSRVLWNSPNGNTLENAHENNHYNVFENETFEIKDFNDTNIILGICLTHWGRVTHMRHWTGLSFVQVVTRPLFGANDDFLWIEPLGTKFSEIFIEINTFSLTKLHWKVLSAKVAAILPQPQCVNNEFTVDLRISRMLIMGTPWKSTWTKYSYTWYRSLTTHGALNSILEM